MTDIFKNQTTNITSDEFAFRGGTLRVEIAGELDGADVTTWMMVSPLDVPSPVKFCSWRTSEQETLFNADLGGQRNLRPAIIVFTIVNVGTSTDISLSANVEKI